MEDSLADKAPYTEGKISILPRACEKNSTFFAIFILEEKSEMSCCSLNLASGLMVFAKLPLSDIRWS